MDMTNYQILRAELNKIYFQQVGLTDTATLRFLDDPVQCNGMSRAGFRDKGLLKARITGHIYDYLGSYKIPTYMESYEKNDTLRVKPVQPIPICVFVYNMAVESICHRFNLPEARELTYPIVEYYLETTIHELQMINPSHVYALDYATPDDMKHIERMTLKINAVLKAFFERRMVKLAFYRLKFGKHNNKIFLEDEFSPDTARFFAFSDQGIVDSSSFGVSDEQLEATFHKFIQLTNGE
jgi:phosphoribosylaminoimidazole-succinocarboxamide synthase